MLVNISGYSVDKVKFLAELTPDVMSNLEAEFEEVWGDVQGPQGGRAYTIQSVKKGTVEGTWLYVFDVWGEYAQRADQLHFETWYPHLSRVDLKLPMPMTEDGRDNYRDYLKEKVGENRSVRLMDSPPRQKRGNRDAGGHTLALGSHKSDYRVHWTLRTNEDGYQEFQLEGSRIKTGIGFQRLYAVDARTNPDKYGWRPMMQQLLTWASMELSEIDGLYDKERAEILAGSVDVHGVLERKLDYIDILIQRLPRSALFGLYDALNEKLFGTPPAAEELEHETALDEGIEAEDE